MADPNLLAPEAWRGHFSGLVWFWSLGAQPCNALLNHHVSCHLKHWPVPWSVWDTHPHTLSLTCLRGSPLSASVPGNTVPVYMQIGCLETWAAGSRGCCYECGGAFFLFFLPPSVLTLLLLTGEEGKRRRQVPGSFQAPGGKALDSWPLTAGLSLASF